MRLLAWITLALGRRVARWCLDPICAYFVAFSARTARLRLLPATRAWQAARVARDLPPLPHVCLDDTPIHDGVYLLAGKYRYFDVRFEHRCGASCEALFSYLLSC